MKIIELCGKAGVGKDTFAQELISQLEKKGYRCIHVAFADRLKDICKRYLNWNGKKNKSGRELLQFVGTDMFRNKDSDFWVNEVKYMLKVFETYNSFSFVIITDTRFPNEITNLSQEFDCTPYRITRKNFVSKLTEEAQQHPSETALDNFEMEEICLSGNIENLPKEVGEFIKRWEI